jgi:hypothetical protein
VQFRPIVTIIYNIVYSPDTSYIAENDSIERVAVLVTGVESVSFGLFAVYFFDGSK